MSTSPTTPRSLKAWLKQLDSVRLPIVPADHEQVRHALTSSNSSLREVARLIQNSPALALAVLRETNSNPASISAPAESLEVALTRLGLQRTEELLNELPLSTAEAIPRPLRQLQLISQHATQQANGLFASRLARLWHEIHWGSLLFLAPLWSLAAAHPELIETWEKRVLGKGEPARKVEHELLGVSLLSLCLALSEHWRLPAWIIQGYRLLASERRLLVKALHIARDNQHPLQQQQALDADSTLRRWLTQPANTVLLANALALAAHQAWDSPHSRRWQRLTGLYLQLPLGELQQLTHQQAVQSAHLHAATDLWHPAEALLWPWSARHLRPTTAAPAEKSDGVNTWYQHCRELLREPSPFANLMQLTACARDALQASGMSRVLLLLADRTHTRLYAQQATGLAKEASGLTLDPSQSQVLRRLLAQPGQLRLTPTNIAQFSALLPGSLKALFPSEHLLLRSLANNGRAVMLLLADQHGTPLAEASVQVFNKTAQCIERALASFAKRAR